MASNLNQAFLRAYAKDRATQAQPHAPAADRSAPSQQPPLSQRNATPQNVAQQNMFQQPANQPPVPAPHLFSSPAPAAQLQSNHAPAPRPSAPQQTAAGAASVWQRLDSAAGAIAPPHYLQPNSPDRASVNVGAAAPGRTKQAHANAPVAAPMAPMAASNTSQFEASPYATASNATAPHMEMPLRYQDEQAEAFETPAAASSRRRTVADFLYSAGSVPYSAATAQAIVQANAAQRSAPARDLGREPVRHEAEANYSTQFAPVASASVASVDHAHGIAGVKSSQANYAAPMASRMAPPAAPAYGPSGTEMNPQIPLSQRNNRIVRVDVPPTSRSAEGSPVARGANPTPASQPAYEFDSPALREVDDAFSDGLDSASHESATQSLDVTYARFQNGSRQAAPVEQQTRSNRNSAPVVSPSAPRVDYDRMRTAAAISAREEKLRHVIHKPFNPVWEVDNLQWPDVCMKLMEQRAESMAQVGAHLQAACQDGLGVLAVTSPSTGEGRSTVTCCLGILAAHHGMKVAIVDMDLDHPTLCLQTNLEVEHDWRDVLAGEVPMEEAAVHSINDQLTIVPLKPRSGRSALMADDRRIADLLSQLSESFDLIIVDTCRMRSSGSVVAGLVDARIFDAAIVVVDRRNSDQARIEDTVRALQETGIESIGIVDNFAS